MKLRNGFVSNSSSSSFIVVFPKKPNNVDELYDMMFPGLDKNTLIGAYDDKLKALDIVRTVFKDMNSSKEVLDKYRLVEIFQEYIERDTYNSGYAHSFDEKTHFPKIFELKGRVASIERQQTDYRWSIWKKYNIKDWQDQQKNTAVDMLIIKNEKEAKKEIAPIETLIQEMILDEAEKLAERYLKEANSNFLCFFSYADENGKDGSIMEHSDIFRNLNHIRISQH